MSFPFRQEVQGKKGASVLGDLFRFKRQHGITDGRPHLSFGGLVWSAKQVELDPKQRPELEQIEGHF